MSSCRGWGRLRRACPAACARRPHSRTPRPPPARPISPRARRAHCRRHGNGRDQARCGVHRMDRAGLLRCGHGRGLLTRVDSVPPPRAHGDRGRAPDTLPHARRSARAASTALRPSHGLVGASRPSSRRTLRGSARAPAHTQSAARSTAAQRGAHQPTAGAGLRGLRRGAGRIPLRMVLLARLAPVVGTGQALLVTSTLFGIGHWFGHPSGASGVLMAGFAGYVWGRSVLDTRGFFCAWLSHGIQDVVIFLLVMMSGR
ncbi:MAG: CPBP family intramembrane metalloprotease [Chloroflexi bacterium]|nr:MAG: CPBP family intramembrane metalloprotease [Chloroflexota bacterium]